MMQQRSRSGRRSRSSVRVPSLRQLLLIVVVLAIVLTIGLIQLLTNSVRSVGDGKENVYEWRQERDDVNGLKSQSDTNSVRSVGGGKENVYEWRQERDDVNDVNGLESQSEKIGVEWMKERDRTMLETEERRKILSAELERLSGRKQELLSLIDEFERIVGDMEVIGTHNLRLLRSISREDVITVKLSSDDLKNGGKTQLRRMENLRMSLMRDIGILEGIRVRLVNAVNLRDQPLHKLELQQTDRRIQEETWRSSWRNRYQSQLLASSAMPSPVVGERYQLDFGDGDAPIEGSSGLLQPIVTSYHLPYQEDDVPYCLAGEMAIRVGEGETIGGLGPLSLRRALHNRHSMNDVHGFYHSKRYELFLRHLRSGALFAPGAREWLQSMEALKSTGHASESTESKKAASRRRKPDVLVVMADDLGFADLGFLLPSNRIRTPVLDALAENAIHIDQHRSHSYCGPARAAFLTGVLHHRLGGSTGPFYNISFGCDQPISGAFGLDGYYNIMSGKWHHPEFLGQHLDRVYNSSQGLFDHNFGFKGGMVSEDYYNRVRWRRNGDGCEDPGYATDLIAAELVEKIRERSELIPEEPLFMFASFNAPHTPNSAPYDILDYYVREYQEDRQMVDELSKKHSSERSAYLRLCYAAMITALDRGIGAILEALLDTGRLDNTVIAFMGDNGGPASEAYLCNGRLRGGKATPFEGGVRTPAFVVAARDLGLGRRRIYEQMHIVDWWQTLTDMVGINEVIAEATVTQDSRSVWNALVRQKTHDTPQSIADRELREVTESISSVEESVDHLTQSQRVTKHQGLITTGDNRESVSGSEEVEDSFVVDFGARTIQLDSLHGCMVKGDVKLTIIASGLVSCDKCVYGNQFALFWNRPVESAPISPIEVDVTRREGEDDGDYAWRMLRAQYDVADGVQLVRLSDQELPGSSQYAANVTLTLFNLKLDPSEVMPIAEVPFAPGNSPQQWLALLRNAAEYSRYSEETRSHALQEAEILIGHLGNELRDCAIVDVLKDFVPAWMAKQYTRVGLPYLDGATCEKSSGPFPV